MKADCRYCGDEITHDAEYDYWAGETGRCPKAPRGLHAPVLHLIGSA